MFKKSLNCKTSPPLRTSDRKKLRNQIIKDFNLPSPEDGDLLVPEGLQSAKFTAHSGEDQSIQGIVYIDPSTNDPLWFTIGKAATDYIPTVYTLWKQPLLFSIDTPVPTLQKVIGGEDLMIPGVNSLFHHSATQLPSLPVDSLVAVTEYGKNVPIAVGRLVLPSNKLKVIVNFEKDVKGKAVLVIHSFKDALWEMGSKSSPPNELVGPTTSGDETNEETLSNESNQGEAGPSSSALGNESIPSDMDSLLRLSLLRTISSLSSSPATFPIPSTQFLQSHLQPSRPFPSSLLDLKKSTYKNLTKFLKTVEKEGLIKTKEFKGAGLSILSVNKLHPDVAGFPADFRTVGEVQEMEKRKKEGSKERGGRVAMMIIEKIWEPLGQSHAFFEKLGKSTTYLYTRQELRALVTSYISEHSLIHPTRPQHIILDDLLKDVFRKKNANKVLLRRDEATTKLFGQMQPWYSIQREGGTEIIKKGALKPILVTTRIRAGGKACTIITNLEAYSISCEDMAEELTKVFTGATSFGAIPGSSTKEGEALMEVLVQGRHATTVKEMLLAKGVPKKFLQEVDLTVTKETKQ